MDGIGYLNSADVEYSPVFGIQAALNGARHHTPDVNQSTEVAYMNPDDAYGVSVGIDSTPRWVAGYGLAAIGVLALLKWGGFRFVIGNTR